MSDYLTPFLFQGEFLVRTILREDGQPWFVAVDVCAILGLRNVPMAVAGLEDDEKGISIVDTLGGRQSVIVVSESGLYALIFRSRKPQAVVFRKWVTAEVLPALRRTGRYEAGKPLDVTPPKDGTGRNRFTLEEWRTFLSILREYRMMFGIIGERWMAAYLEMPLPPETILAIAWRQLDLFRAAPDAVAGEEDDSVAGFADAEPEKVH